MDSTSHFDSSMLMSAPKEVCKVLSVEDDADYQMALMNSLSALQYDGKKVEFLKASSASEAAVVIAENPDIAVIFLDVVMETDRAGLGLVGTIREVIGNDLVRIVLLTGQPGMMPTDNLVGQYDIDDYWCKSDLTQAHLQTIVLSNIRTWEHLLAMQEARHSMQLLLFSSQRLSSKKDMLEYTHSILEEISHLLKIEQGGIVCFFNSEQEKLEDALIVAASGEYSPYIHQFASMAIKDEILTEAARQTSLSKKHTFLEGFSVLYFSNKELDGRDYIVVVKLNRNLTSNEVNLLQVFCENISAGFRNVALNNKLSELAYIEPTSGIHNKNWLVREIRHMFSWEREKAKLLMLHVEDLAYTESVLGTKYCDQLTLSLYEYLCDFFDNAVDVALFERDTIVMLIYDNKEYHEANLEQIIHPSVTVEDAIHSLDLTISLVNFSDFPNYEAEQLVSVGKSTLERAKYEGVSFLAFSEELASAMFSRYELLKELRDVILQDEMEVYFQPKVSLIDNKLIGFEALARWKNRSGNFVSPEQFITLAESSGLVDKLDRQILRKTCKAINELKDIGVSVPISVNVAGNEIARPNYFEQFTAILCEENIDNNLIELEITESQFIEEKTTINRHLDTLKEIGVRVNIDDFGTGYSSLTYLSTLSVSTIKIDQSFVWRMENSAKDWKILKMIIELGRSLGLDVIAEGIETEQQKEHLLKLGCEQGQGYLFAKPMPLTEVMAWVKS
ncbi:GGDEF/EAL domain-containing response regulator [Marinomonas sp. TW1]|uniref:GGDEF/EAL domain-containing response regulator n=1 Tax=Marinomonas sp. TW1 TaxID=1561203 RepID=UPI0007AF7ACC|nr:EAL domain-containing protein [Marinomonas sp. TW1]KZN12516.1 diguanylate cyclase [Marinomonas sp. TW1]